MIEPGYREHVPNHPDVFKPYMGLLGYTATLLYILDNIRETEVEPFMVEKVIARCEKTTSEVESYVDTIEIDADPEARATLERAKQIPF
jgi:hypothetical protein